MKISSTRFGELEVAEAQLINFPYGIPGFPGEKQFAHLNYELDSPFSFLQSTTEPNLTFLLADAFVFFSDYEFELGDEITEELELSKENPPQIFLIVTAKDKIENMTANLLAPLVVNQNKNIGKQVIINKPEYSIRHKLFPEGLLEESAKGGA